MRRTIVSLSFYLAAALLTVLVLSCEKDNPAGSGKQPLTASENPVMLTVSGSRTVTISGGQGPCSVKSISDSSIVDASVYNYSGGDMLMLWGMAIGTASVVVQDSAQAAEVEISITVAIMAASPSNISLQVGSTQYVSIAGGTQPYAIASLQDTTVASVYLGTSYVLITGVSPGSTSLVVKDNASPANTVTISITVTPKPSFTTAGNISFSSDAGNFSANGIVPEMFPDVRTLPVNSEGAGGEFYLQSASNNYGVIIGYRKQNQTTADIIEILFAKSTLGRGQVSIDTLEIIENDKANVVFVIGGDLNSQNPDMYAMHSGTMTFTTLTSKRATGTFSGTATLIRNNVAVSGHNISVTNGTFDVPLLEDIQNTISNGKRQQMSAYAEKMFKKQLMKMKPAGQRDH